MVKVGSYQAKTHLPQLLKRVARGERITITRHGTPVAMLVPCEDKPQRDVRAVIEEMKAFRKGRKLGKVTIRELIEEGRRF
jgi:prevent-host-death family protein